MSDYYFDDDVDNFSDEDGYAGGGGFYDHDDLFDDVEEGVGYDIWDIDDPEYDFDEERFLFEFDPWIENDFDFDTGSYQSLVRIAEMLSKILHAWRKRSGLIDLEEEESSLKEVSDSDQHWNLYQMDPEDRTKLRSNSVKIMSDLLGGKSAIHQFTEKVDKTVILLKQVLNLLLDRCLPVHMPYPVMSTLISHLLEEGGLDMLGTMAEGEEDSEEQERQGMEELLNAMGSVYDETKSIMFDYYYESFPNILSYVKECENSFIKFEAIARSYGIEVPTSSGDGTLDIVV